MPEKSEAVKAMDSIQNAARRLLKPAGFRVRGRTFNRLTDDGLTEVIGFQMGSFDPPGTTYVEGFTEDLYGKFTVNLGVHVPEVARHHGGGAPRGFAQDWHCSIRAGLGEVGPEGCDLWWSLFSPDSLAEEITVRLAIHALPFLARFNSRDRILAEWRNVSSSRFAGSPPRIVAAILLWERGETEEARTLLAAQSQETLNPGHPAYVRELARRLDLGPL